MNIDMKHPTGQNVTACMIGLKNTLCKNLTKNGELQR